MKYFHEIPSDFVYYLNHDKIYNQEIEYYYQDIGFNRNTKLHEKRVSFFYNHSENNFRHNTGYVKSGIILSL
ncbi:hypothetical protein ES708_19489 [subsurface metagenome]